MAGADAVTIRLHQASPVSGQLSVLPVISGDRLCNPILNDNVVSPYIAEFFETLPEPYEIHLDAVGLGSRRLILGIFLRFLCLAQHRPGRRWQPRACQSLYSSFFSQPRAKSKILKSLYLAAGARPYPQPIRYSYSLSKAHYQKMTQITHSLS